MAPVTFYLPVILSPIYGIALLIVSTFWVTGYRGYGVATPRSFDYTLRVVFDPGRSFVRMIAYRGMISAATVCARTERREHI